MASVTTTVTNTLHTQRSTGFLILDFFLRLRFRGACVLFSEACLLCSVFFLSCVKLSSSSVYFSTFLAIPALCILSELELSVEV